MSSPQYDPQGPLLYARATDLVRAAERQVDIDPTGSIASKPLGWGYRGLRAIPVLLGGVLAVGAGVVVNAVMTAAAFIGQGVNNPNEVTPQDWRNEQSQIQKSEIVLVADGLGMAVAASTGLLTDAGEMRAKKQRAVQAEADTAAAYANALASSPFGPQPVIDAAAAIVRAQAQAENRQPDGQLLNAIYSRGSGTPSQGGPTPGPSGGPSL